MMAMPEARRSKTDIRREMMMLTTHPSAKNNDVAVSKRLMLDATPNAVMPELLTRTQMAELCQVSERTAWQWAKDGIAPPPLKIGKGTVRYSRRAYEQWVSAGCKPCNGGLASAT
jgi:predicted DNA-binding transcriptional regulator AlpA